MVSRTIDNLFGRGEAAVTVPPLDGALQPNRLLDEATERFVLEGVDCLAIHDGALVASAGNGLFVLVADVWQQRKTYPGPVVALSPVGDDGLAVALADGEIIIEGGAFDGRRYRLDKGVTCITAITADGATLFVANGSATSHAGAWRRDLLERNASGSVWRLDLDDGASTLLADKLAWPAGLAVAREGLAVSEAWRHRLLRIDPSRPSTPLVLQADLPGYPGRISPAAEGYWLAMFAPRSQLVEFILRERAYRTRMMAQVPEPYWVAPSYRSGRSFYESLQGGGVKQLGMLKPWAPSMSIGLCVKLDPAFQPRSSLQSRADGKTHGVTSTVELKGDLFVAARGDGVVVSMPLAQLTECRP